MHLNIFSSSPFRNLTQWKWLLIWTTPVTIFILIQNADLGFLISSSVNRFHCFINLRAFAPYAYELVITDDGFWAKLESGLSLKMCWVWWKPECLLLLWDSRHNMNLPSLAFLCSSFSSGFYFLQIKKKLKIGKYFQITPKLTRLFLELHLNLF